MRFARSHWTSRAAVVALAAALCIISLARAQSAPRHEAVSYHTNSTLVLVPVTVVDRRGATVKGLAGDAFTLTDGGVRQQIRAFSEEDAPVSIGVVLDLSGSMRSVVEPAKQALQALLKDANPADEAFLNVVSTHPVAYSGFTGDFDSIFTKVEVAEPSGDTALIDTLYESLKQLRSGRRARKALLVISDGIDNHSRFTRKDLLDRAMETDAQIYVIAVGAAPPPHAKGIEVLEARRGLYFLEELSDKTGGLSFITNGRVGIAGAIGRIGRAFRDQYTLGFVPTVGVHGNAWHRIKVNVAGPGRRAYAREGYHLN